MTQRSGSRQWIKLWVGPWLDGTTRFEMSGAQRAFWVDVLAMAGRSRIDGVACAGEVDGKIVGYPISKFQGLITDPIDALETLRLFERMKKIRIVQTQQDPVPLLAVFVLNWGTYQSEYQRQKPYRTNKLRDGLQLELQQSDKKSDNESNALEVEVEVEVRSKKKEESLKDLPLLGSTSSPGTPENPNPVSLSSEHLTSKSNSNGNTALEEKIKCAEKQISDAQQELKKHPNSAGAKRAVDEAIESLRKIAAENPHSRAVGTMFDGLAKTQLKKLAAQKAMP